MITPRRTRLIRAADLHEFRQAVRTVIAKNGQPASAIVLPTQAAATQLARVLPADSPPILVTRDQLYDLLQSRMRHPPRRLNTFEREAIAQAAAEQAVREVGELPFQVRPGLVSEMLRFYDQLRRQSQQVDRFEELITGALEASAGSDRGADRLLAQTRFLVATFREYARRVEVSGACDEHGLRERLLVGELLDEPVSHIVITVGDWIADPSGLFVADFDLLSRIPGLKLLDVISTVEVLRSGFHHRIDQWLPDLEQIEATDLTLPASPIRPTLALPTTDPDRVWFTYRDREDELRAIADRLGSGDDNGAPVNWDRVAVVFKHPLPYLYLAPDTFGAAGIPYHAADALPLAAEPVAATIDLVLEAVETAFSRDALIALLRTPHLAFGPTTHEFRRSIAELNAELSDKRYLGGLERLEAIAGPDGPEGPHDNGPEGSRDQQALTAALALARELSPLALPRPASEQLRALTTFVERHFRPLDRHDEFVGRERAGRDAILTILNTLADARARHHDAPWTIEDLAASVRRWIGEETFTVERSPTGIQLLDDQAARYGDFDDLTIVGLVENEWPERPRRNIFCPPVLLKSLGWASEKDRRAADEARFLDLLASASRELALFTFTLDDEVLVSRSMLLDEVPRARLSAVHRQPAFLAPAPDADADWAGLRAARSPSSADMFHGRIGDVTRSVWSVSALETYTTCPFKFFAQHILKLDEEPDDEQVMDPRHEGTLVHTVFETFFREWQQSGHRSITAENLDAARAEFAAVVDRLLVEEHVPEGEAGLARTRLLGSSAAAGLGEAVFRMEAERPIPVIERLLEHDLKGDFVFQTEGGSRTVTLKGKVDRIDLLEDGTFRLIDYKLGWPPDKTRALQLPIYGICAEQRLGGRHGRQWTLGEAMYLAFKGPKRVVPLFAPANRNDVLTNAQQRLSDTLDAIARGEFPPTPEDVFRCETCSFSTVCRKDYVGDV